MKSESIETMEGGLRLHTVRIEFDLQIGRPAPRVSNPDAPGFGDPGELGGVSILGAVMLKPGKDGKPVERRLCGAMVRRMGESVDLCDYLFRRSVTEGIYVRA